MRQTRRGNAKLLLPLLLLLLLVAATAVFAAARQRPSPSSIRSSGSGGESRIDVPLSGPSEAAANSLSQSSNTTSQSSNTAAPVTQPGVRRLLNTKDTNLQGPPSAPSPPAILPSPPCVLPKLQRVLIIADHRTSSTSLLQTFRAFGSSAFYFFEPFASTASVPKFKTFDAGMPTYEQLFSCSLPPMQWRRIMWPEACKAVYTHKSPQLERCINGDLTDLDVATLQMRCRAATYRIVKTIRFDTSPLDTLHGFYTAALPEPNSSSSSSNGSPLCLIRLTRRDPVGIILSAMRLNWFNRDLTAITKNLCKAMTSTRETLAKSNLPVLRVMMEDYVRAPQTLWDKLAPHCSMPWLAADRQRMQKEISRIFIDHRIWLAKQARGGKPYKAETNEQKAEVMELWQKLCPSMQDVNLAAEA